MIDIKDFNPNLLKIDKKSCKNIDIYYIGYVTIKDFDYADIHSVNPLYFIAGEVDGYIEEKNWNKYFIFASTDKNKKALTKYTKIWIKLKIWLKK